MQKELVSIITPCYNTGKYVHRLLDSILEQDYPYVEMFAIDDGSTDNTDQVIKSYIPKFQNKGYVLTYIKQENGGQSSAINNGLKLVSGEYLIWPDSDDYFREPYALTHFVNALKSHDESIGVVRCIPTYVDEETLNDLTTIKLSQEYLKEEQFENCLYSTNFFWGAGDYMIKMECLDKVNPAREIYVNKNAGQNWQMLLPVLYSYKCFTLRENLFNILERFDSHSRGQYATYEQLMCKFFSYRDTLLFTLDKIQTMSSENKELYRKSIINKYKLQELTLAVKFNKKSDQRRIINELKSFNVTIPYKELYVIKLTKTVLGRFVYKLYSKIKIYITAKSKCCD